MAINTGRISVAKKGTGGDGNSIRNSLHKMGLSRFPGTRVTLLPFRDTDGSYRTGLDENAMYIKRLSEADQEQEIARVKGLREMAMKFYPESFLDGRSSFYTDCSRKFGDVNVAPVAALKDDDNIFDLNDPQQLITYAYLRVHPSVAPSSSALMSGRGGKNIMFYVNDFDVEVATEYKIKSQVGKAHAKLQELTPSTRKMVARQLGYGVNDEASEESVYNKLYDFIEEGSKVSKRSNIELFNKFANMDSQNLEVRDTVKQGVTFSVIRKSSGVYWRGEERLGTTEEEVTNYLTNPTNLEAYLSIQEEIKAKKAMKSM